jgi:hypothetical protein
MSGLCWCRSLIRSKGTTVGCYSCVGLPSREGLDAKFCSNPRLLEKMRLDKPQHRCEAESKLHQRRMYKKESTPQNGHYV